MTTTATWVPAAAAPTASSARTACPSSRWYEPRDGAADSRRGVPFLACRRRLAACRRAVGTHLDAVQAFRHARPHRHHADDDELRSDRPRCTSLARFAQAD